MIKVILGTNFDKNSVIVPKNTTIKKVLEDNNINAAGKLVYVGSTAVTDHSKTFADIGVTDECLLTCATKADGGLL